MNDALLSAQQMADQCVCVNVQRAARAVARRYDAALRPLGLTSGQFAILAALNRAEPVAITALADALGLERTTLTRNLVPLKVRRLVNVGSDAGDHRVRAVSLTAMGRVLLSDAMPLWRAEQVVSVDALDAATWSDARQILARLSAV